MSATISDCGKYRYSLERQIAPVGKTIAYFGINPSTAGPIENDPSVCKMIGFSEREGAGRMIVGNVFAYRSKDVKDLLLDPLPAFSLVHQGYLKQIMGDADVLVPCWGSRTKVPKALRHHFDNMLALLLNSGKPVLHFGCTKSGDPLHPLFLSYTTPLIPWEIKK